jgi:hypothetical protein
MIEDAAVKILPKPLRCYAGVKIYRRSSSVLTSQHGTKFRERPGGLYGVLAGTDKDGDGSTERYGEVSIAP